MIQHLFSWSAVLVGSVVLAAIVSAWREGTR